MKQSEIKNLSVAELQDKLVELRKNYTELKATHLVSPIQNPLQIRMMRRTIARVATEITKREIQ
ncbi:MAG: 50S ribosomal protein L29 [Bacteroidota bacterium]|nr:50S ribosomal protein L29 [Bacteroidota bacterium]